MSTKDYLQTTGRALFGAIPYVGTALNEAVFEHRSRIKRERFEAFMRGVADDVGKLKDSAIDHAYLQSDDFVDFFESLLQRVLRNRSAEKLARFRSLFVGQIQVPVDTDFRETFLDIITNMTEKQIEILAAHRQHGRFDTPYRKSEFYGLCSADYRFFVQDLISKGLMVDDSMSRFDCRPLDVLEVTEMGLKFLNFVESSRSEQ